MLFWFRRNWGSIGWVGFHLTPHVNWSLGNLGPLLPYWHWPYFEIWKIKNYFLKQQVFIEFLPGDHHIVGSGKAVMLMAKPLLSSDVLVWTDRKQGKKYREGRAKCQKFLKGEVSTSRTWMLLLELLGRTFLRKWYLDWYPVIWREPPMWKSGGTFLLEEISIPRQEGEVSSYLVPGMLECFWVSG